MIEMHTVTMARIRSERKSAVADKVTDEGERREPRRGFLKFLGLGGVVGTAATLLGGRGQAEAAEAPEPGYRETEHVARYYESTRF